MSCDQLTIEILKLLVSVATPLLVAIFGFRLTKKLEEAKGLIDRDKEWSTKWADSFLNEAKAFSSKVSKLMILFVSIEDVRNDPNMSPKEKTDELSTLEKSVRERIHELREHDWSLRSLARFALDNHMEFRQATHDLINYLNTLLTGSGDLAPVENLQHAYNEATRKVHAVLLKMPS